MPRCLNSASISSSLQSRSIDDVKPLERTRRRWTVFVAAAFDGGSAFGGSVLRIMIGNALCLGIGGLGKVVLDGTGVGGDKGFGVLNVPGIRSAGD